MPAAPNIAIETIQVGAANGVCALDASGWVPTTCINPSQVGSLPTGLICMWSGLLTAIPSGWNLCDGTNGTPDLRDRFILGAHAGDNPGSTGGANTHTHADHVFTGQTTLTTFSGGVTPAGTIAWPVGVPTFSGSQGTVPAQTFTGSALAATTFAIPTGSGSFKGTNTGGFSTVGGVAPGSTGATTSKSPGTPAGTNSTAAFTPQGTVAWPAGVPMFTGSALSLHEHSLVPIGGVDSHSTANNVPLYLALAFIMKS